jgi:hypothetical protein
MDRLGSLNRAAKALGLYYRAAWGRIKQSEEIMGEALVEAGEGAQGLPADRFAASWRLHSAFLREVGGSPQGRAQGVSLARDRLSREVERLNEPTSAADVGHRAIGMARNSSRVRPRRSHSRMISRLNAAGKRLVLSLLQLLGSMPTMRSAGQGAAWMRPVTVSPPAQGRSRTSPAGARRCVALFGAGWR